MLTIGNRRRRAAPPALLAALAALLLLPASAAGQYFGRNKVQYETFDFKILRTEHFDVYYYEEERRAAEYSARLAERWYARLSRVLDHQLSRRQPLILYASHPDFEQTNAIPGEIGEGTGGVTEFAKRRIVLPLAGHLRETDHVIGHELVHAFQFDIVGSGRSAGGLGGAPAVARLPLWFVEGMAEYLSIGPDDPHTAMWMRDAARANKLPTVGQLYDNRYFPYRYGQALWAYVAGRWGDDKVAQALKLSGRSANAERAIAMVTGAGPDTLSRDWHQAIRDWYHPLRERDVPLAAAGRVVLAGHRDREQLHLAPALSPDGRQVVFLSERGRFSIEMYLADVATGRIRKRITRSALDPHLESIQFIHSAGSFSPDGRRFAFAAVEEGRPEIHLYDLERERVVQELEFDELDEIFHPTWSPDGSRIAFTANQGGFLDLFRVEVATGSVRRLTNDPFADLQPAWSPDGSRIAFVTDRFTTDLRELSFGEDRLAVLDPDGGEPTQVRAFAGGKHINPQWSPDGRELYFIADQGGISNVYRVPVAGGEVTQVTRLTTGVSGITALSPALSVAREAGTIVCSAYADGAYHLVAVASPTVAAGPAAGGAPAGAGGLPPLQRTNQEVAALVADPRLGLAGRPSFTERRYRPSLSLDNVSQAALGVGASGGQFAVGGGVTLLWSDMLGDHNLVTLLQYEDAGGGFVRSLAAGAAYQNLRHRWHWGGQLSQIPVVTRGFAVDTGTLGGEPAVREQEYRSFRVERDVFGSIAYPFSRAQRVELSLGGRSIDFSGEIETHIYSQITGQLLQETIEPLPEDSIPTIQLGVASAALVYDNSYFGGTSPLLGQRYRLEVSPVVGDLAFLGVLADWRRYQPLARPLTLAGRVLHFGRYGADSDDPTVGDLFLGYPSLMRGYDSGSFTAEECETGDCPEFDQLLGSRIAVANLELRLPLIGGIGLVPASGFPPVEVAAFFDAGMAWRRNEPGPFGRGARDPVTSHGLALRLNLFGFAVGEVTFVHPNDRPQKGWYWQFNLQPGF